MAKRRYKIHPAIGIARVGNADADSFFIGPELPVTGPTGDPKCATTVPPFKADKDKEKIKPQAARFRIWEYRKNKDGKWEASREIDLSAKGVGKIEWNVHLANKKASFFDFDGLRGETGAPAGRRNTWAKGKDRSRYLEIDPGARTISGKSKKGVEFRAEKGHPQSQT